MREIGQEEFNLWLEDPVTETFFAHCNKRRLDLMNEWANGAFTAPDSVGSAQLNAAAVGKAMIYGEILALTYEDIEEGVKE